MARLSIDLTDTQHQSVKALAALQGKSIKDYAVERLLPSASGFGSSQDVAWSELKSLIEKRIADGLDGGISPHTMDSIIEDELSKEAATEQEKAA